MNTREKQYQLSERFKKRLASALNLSQEQENTASDHQKIHPIDISLDENHSTNSILHGLVASSQSEQSELSSIYAECIIAACVGYPTSLKPDEMLAVILGVKAMQLKPFIYTEAASEASQKDFNENQVACFTSLIPPSDIQSIDEMRKHAEWRKLYFMLEYTLTAASTSEPWPSSISLADIDLLQLEDWQRIAVSSEVQQISKISTLTQEQQKKLEKISLEIKKNEIRPNNLKQKIDKLKKIRGILFSRLDLDAQRFIENHGEVLNIANKQESRKHFSQVATDALFWMSKSDSAKNTNGAQERKIILLGKHEEPVFVAKVRQQAQYLFGRNTHSIEYVKIDVVPVPDPTLNNNNLYEIDDKNEKIEAIEMGDNQISEVENSRSAEELNKIIVPLCRSLLNEGKVNTVAELLITMADMKAQNQSLKIKSSTPTGTSPSKSLSPIEQASMRQPTSPSFYNGSYTTFRSPVTNVRNQQTQSITPTMSNNRG